MKKTCFLLLSLFLSSTLFAQTKTTIYGNLGVGHVNISIMNTQYGTSSDAKGHYELPIYDCTTTVNLYYSCIGYQDTLVRLTPKLLQHDSINISFRMRKHDYNLQEVTVTAKQKLFGERYFFMDFEVFDHTIYILAARPSKKQFCLIMADEDLHGLDTIPLPTHIKPEKIMRDCLGNCQLIANDSVYQVDLTDKPYKFIAAEKSFFFNTMSDCLFATDEHVYFKDKGMRGYFTSFYRVDRQTSQPQQLFTSDMTDALEDYYRELIFHINHPSGGADCPLGVYARFTRTHWYRPSDAELLLADNSLYYFDQSLGTIRHYDLSLHKIDSCTILYPSMEGWKHTLYQDLAQNKIYTIVDDQLFEIDPTSGSIAAKTTLIYSLYSKIVIHNGHLFLLKKAHDSFGGTRTFIERRKL